MAAAMPSEDARLQTPSLATPGGSGSLCCPPVPSPSHPRPIPSLPIDEQHPNQESENPPDYHRGSSAGDISMSGSKSDAFRENSHKQAKPNKVYIGGLPEHTREADLQNCFGKIGNIVNIELKVGYGFVEFDTREAAEESVAKYNEGHFMGNKIKVELSHGGGRTAKFSGDPGACFRCGQMGHWARCGGNILLLMQTGLTPRSFRECPSNNGVPYQRRGPHDPPLIDRIQRDSYGARGAPPRDEYRYAPPPPRDSRYEYIPPPRRPSPPREYRDYGPPQARPPRDYDDYRRGPPPPVDRDRYAAPPPPQDYRGGRYPPPDPAYRGGYGGPPAPPPQAPYDRYDRRNERYANYPPAPPPARGRSPPPRGRDDYDRLPPRQVTGCVVTPTGS
ncbi:hypothetical protein NP233_g8311 [Leucocoprinus birnbaumii]|uniref:RRM domain-containing protein n=1 Tax=Leucocoprinus birnbaumii TaxID=56174 RepID=A0AAD5YN99_9AGAR|nr:hypothetical protein NP233_g8311 [Leucocoprinus birnbaumii]